MPQHQGVKLKELYYSHGYPALAQALQGMDASEIAFRYPFNRTIIESAVGVIVHSDVSLRLARQWFWRQGCEQLAPHPVAACAGSADERKGGARASATARVGFCGV